MPRRFRGSAKALSLKRQSYFGTRKNLTNGKRHSAMKIATTMCDNCATQKHTTNHWYKLLILTEPTRGLFVVPVELFDRVPFETWKENFISVVDSCGEKCTLAMTQRFLATGKLLDA